MFHAFNTEPTSPVYSYICSGGTLTYLHADRVGTIIANTDSSGTVTNKTALSTFGEGTVNGTTFGFTGQRLDSETGLYYFKRRYYAPSTGRFLQPDPLSYDGGDLNLYTYVANSPLKYTDPMGLEGPTVLPTGAGVTQTSPTTASQSSVGGRPSDSPSSPGTAGPVDSVRVWVRPETPERDFPTPEIPKTPIAVPIPGETTGGTIPIPPTRRTPNGDIPGQGKLPTPPKTPTTPKLRGEILNPPPGSKGTKTPK